MKFLRAQGGAHTVEDFAEFEPEWVEPISTTYRGWQVYELPPNGQGVAALSMLNIMENFPLKDYGHNSAAALHVMIEAKKLAYADMARYVGDPRFGAGAGARRCSRRTWRRRRAGLIDMDKASCKVLPSEISQTLDAHGHETIYMSAIDKEGNIVSLIQSNYSGYGTGMVAPGAGFSFHNRGAGFDMVPGKPNSLAGHKRPLHTIIPAFMRKGDIAIGFGIMGGWNQSQAHAQFVANVVDFNMNVQMALESARFTKATFEGCDVQIESRVADAVRAGADAARAHPDADGRVLGRDGQRRGGDAGREARREFRGIRSAHRRRRHSGTARRSAAARARCSSGGCNALRAHAVVDSSPDAQSTRGRDPCLPSVRGADRACSETHRKASARDRDRRRRQRRRNSANLRAGRAIPAMSKCCGTR